MTWSKMWQNHPESDSNAGGIQLSWKACMCVRVCSGGVLLEMVGCSHLINEGWDRFERMANFKCVASLRHLANPWEVYFDKRTA